LFAAAKKRRALRLFFATDLHGSEVCFRKFLAAAKVYQANVLILGGDFAGKGLMPVLRRGESWSARLDGQDLTVPLADYDQLAGDITRRGFYPVQMDDDEVARLSADSAALDELFKAEITAQAKRWCELGPFLMASLGVVPITPWNTERECSEEEIALRIEQMLEPYPADTKWILNFHSPPYATGLDDAPELDATLKPVIRGGRPSIVPVGSKAVKDAIKKYQPVVALHGHIHESRGVQKIGKTLCINPGSDYSSGVLRGAVVDLAEDGTCMDFLLTTG
jgi:uncharacterized protein